MFHFTTLLVHIFQQWRSHVQSDWHKEKSELLYTKMRNGEADLNGDEIEEPEKEDDILVPGETRSLKLCSRSFRMRPCKYMRLCPPVPLYICTFITSYLDMDLVINGR